jgi:hypothetical protein
LTSLVHVSEDGVIAYSISMYTEAMYHVLPDHLKEEEDGLRFSNGIEYQIYRQVQ